jgi:hypothetical protein
MSYALLRGRASGLLYDILVDWFACDSLFLVCWGFDIFVTFAIDNLTLLALGSISCDLVSAEVRLRLLWTTNWDLMPDLTLGE